MNLSKEEIEELIDQKIQQGIEMYGKSCKLFAFELINLVKSLTDNIVQPQQSRIIPLSEWDKYHQYPTIPALRQYYFYREKNGFSEVVEYGGNNGGRILINEDKFFEWLRKRNEAKQKTKQ